MARIVRSSLTGGSDRPVTVYTDASRPDARARQDDVLVGTVVHVVHHQVQVDHLHLAVVALAPHVRAHLALARWGGGGARLGQSEDLRGLDFEFSHVGDRPVRQLQQHGLRVTGSAGDVGHPLLRGRRPVQGEGLQKEPSADDEKERDSPESPEIIDITGDDEFIDLSGD